MPWLQKISLLITAGIFINFLYEVWLALMTRNWGALATQSLALLILGFITWLFWNDMQEIFRDIQKYRENARERIEKNKGKINIKDAFLFSLLWSNQIYKDIPDDRKDFVKTSFILIGLALFVFYKNWDGHLVLFFILAALILAGANLLIWVVGSERQEKNRMAIELEAARKMQLSLMPSKPPQIKGFDIAGCCIPASDVGGDLFDFVWIGKKSDKLCIPVVDVSGKGMDAALTAVYTSGALVSETQHEDDVAKVAHNLNSAILSRNNRSRFVSLLMIALDVSSQKIEYVNAGQTKPILLRNEQFVTLKGTGARFPLGVMKTPHYQSEGLQLMAGDILLLYTDGVTEAMNAELEMFGENRLQMLFLDLARQRIPASDMALHIKNEVIHFSGLDEQQDDLTIVVLKVLS